MSEPLLSVANLTKEFPLKGGLFSRHAASVHAVDGVDFHVDRGETLGLVGESGCGKSTTGRCVLRLIEPSSGEIHFDGKDVRVARGRRTSHPAPRHPDHLSGPLRVAQSAHECRRDRRRSADHPPIDQNQAAVRRARGGFAGNRRPARRTIWARYPNEFSGGQRQRIGIARALAVEPKLIICDEPVSALDVSIQAQVINLLEDLQEKFGLAYLFIAHDLAVVEHISKRIAVMYLGRIVEMASAHELYASPRHPYTEALLSAVPIPDPKVKRQRIRLSGEVPSPISPADRLPLSHQMPDRAVSALQAAKRRRSSKAPTATGSPAISAEGSLRGALFHRDDPAMAPFPGGGRKAHAHSCFQNRSFGIIPAGSEENSGLMRLR